MSEKLKSLRYEWLGQIRKKDQTIWKKDSNENVLRSKIVRLKIIVWWWIYETEEKQVVNIKEKPDQAADFRYQSFAVLL